MSKFREFWIWGFKIGDDESISQNCSVHLDSGGSEFYSPVHHVIEYAALEAAQKEIEELKSNPTSAFYKERKLLRDEIENLTTALKVSEDALGATWPNMFNEIHQHHKEALVEIQKIKKGLG